MAGVSAGVAAEGLPGGAVGAIVVSLLILATVCWAIALSDRVHNRRVLVPALIGLGLCGAGLDWPQTDGPGFVVGYMALAGLAMLAPRRIALLSGAPIVSGLAASDAHDSANPASAVLAAALGAGFLLGTSVVAALSRDAYHRAEALLAHEAAAREAREQMAALAERSRLARELHDVLAHSLAGLSMQLQSARLLASQTAADVRLTDHIACAQRLAQDGMRSSRHALQTLRGYEIPGPDKLADLVSETSSTWGIPVEFRTEGTPRPLAQETGLTLYRTVQEALTNVAKHAGRGAQVQVRLTWGADSVEVSVTDSGGDGVDAGLPSTGFGLVSMAERAAAHGGRLDAGPWQGGFRVRLLLPLGRLQSGRRS